MSVALFGGTFDPPHLGHVRIAQAAQRHLGASEVRWVVAGRPPHKEGQSLSSDVHRLAMVQRAIADVPGSVVDDRELRRDGLSYTWRTVEELRRERPGESLAFVIGSDQLRSLHTWARVEWLLDVVRFVTVPRAGFPVDDLAQQVDLPAEHRQALARDVLDMAPWPHASTDLRERVREGRPIDEWVTPTVVQYIREHALYRDALPSGSAPR